MGEFPRFSFFLSHIKLSFAWLPVDGGRTSCGLQARTTEHLSPARAGWLAGWLVGELTWAAGGSLPPRGVPEPPRTAAACKEPTGYSLVDACARPVHPPARSRAPVRPTARPSVNIHWSSERPSSSQRPPRARVRARARGGKGEAELCQEYLVFCNAMEPEEVTRDSRNVGITALHCSSSESRSGRTTRRTF